MEKVIIIRYAEIHLKGKNRGWFERVFAVNMEKSLKGIRHEIHRSSGRYLIENFNSVDTEVILERLKRVFGIHSFSVGFKVGADMDGVPKGAEASVVTHLVPAVVSWKVPPFLCPGAHGPAAPSPGCAHPKVSMAMFAPLTWCA